MVQKTQVHPLRAEVSQPQKIGTERLVGLEDVCSAADSFYDGCERIAHELAQGRINPETLTRDIEGASYNSHRVLRQIKSLMLKRYGKRLVIRRKVSVSLEVVEAFPQ